jgi:hypothetical protein
MDRIPGTTVSNDATDVTGRHGVALTRRGSLGTTEVLFDPTTYRYLGMNLMIEPAGLARALEVKGFATQLMTGQAVQRVAIVDRAGDLP